MGEGRVGTASEITWLGGSGLILGSSKDGLWCRGCPRWSENQVNQMGRGWAWGVRRGRGQFEQGQDYIWPPVTLGVFWNRKENSDTEKILLD